MPMIKVYHNPHFLNYRGDHTDIVPPVRPVATVKVPEDIPVEQALEVAFRKTQHIDDVTPAQAGISGWWNNPGVMLYVRSTSVGDVLEACNEYGGSDEKDNLFVVENMGFVPYQPQTMRPLHHLAEAYRQLDAALAQADTGRVVEVAGQVRNIILQVLETEDDVCAPYQEEEP